MFVSVAIDLALDRLFTYEVPVELSNAIAVGQLVEVPFHGRVARGFVMALAEAADGVSAKGGFRIKSVTGIVDGAPFFSSALLRLVKWVARYTASPIEHCLRTAVPAAVLKPSAGPKELLFVSPVVDAAPSAPLTRHQAELLADIVRVRGGWLQQLCREFKTTAATLRALEKKGVLAIAARSSRRDPLAGKTILRDRPKSLTAQQSAALKTILAPAANPAGAAPLPVLLHGVTGSGKTEIYLQAIASELEAGRGAIVLVPEISLTPQTVQRFAARFGDKVAVLHSALSDGERYDEWHRIRAGSARVVVGPRSAVFAPVVKLGLIVVDEEHDGSYKQDESPRYHARDVALMRGKFENARVVLGSATPSLESWYNVQRGKFALASVSERATGQTLPAVHLIDLAAEIHASGQIPIYSKFLLDAIAERLRNHEQTILFLNRRGYSRVLQCRACGWIAACPNCVGRRDDDENPSLPYTYHEAEKCLRCHICGAWEHVPAECPKCHARDFAYAGIGTQRAEGVLRKCFPHARILRMDADSTARKHSHDDILSAFGKREADILIGTQMIAKGLDFPNVTLVGVLNADSSLNLPDFRAAERTYQLLAQVSGRAGRAHKPGEVYIQTFSPDEPAIRAAADSNAYAAFAAGELAARREGPYPPYCHLASLVFRSQVEAQASGWAELYSHSLQAYAGRFNAAKAEDVRFEVSEAVPAALAKAEGWFRYQVIVRAPQARDLVEAVKWLRQTRPAPNGLKIAFDVDAVNLM